MGYRYLNMGTAVPVFAAEPPVATEGSLYYNSTSEVFYICNGTQWNLVSNASPTTTGGTRTIDALSEGGTFSYDLGTDFTDDVDTDGELTYTLASGTLPSGCTLPTTGNSAFTGTASGVSSNTNYTWTIKVTDTSGGTATQDYQQTINTVSPTVTGGTVTISSVSEGGSASYDVDTDFTFGTGSTFSAYSLQSGSLPSGTSLATATGVISGTAGNVSSNTAYTFTIRGTDTDGDTVDQSYSWTINTITPTSTGGTVTISNTSEGASASYDVDTNFSYPTGSTFSAYSLQSGSLPNGLSLNTTSGVISGTAGNSGSASFTIRATDTDGDVKDQAYSWTITNVAPTSTGGTVTISSVQEGLSASYDVDTNFTFTTGSAFSAYSLASGSLPSGLSLNTSTGVISGTMGTVSADTASSFTIRATDTDGDTVDQAYSWTITDIPPYSVDYLVIAGAGGGGYGQQGHNAGGGGAGGYRNSYNSETSGRGSASETAKEVTTGIVYTVTIGAGGAGGPSAENRGASGSNSVFSTITSTGGGAGGAGGNSGVERQGLAGGAGGGTASSDTTVLGGGAGTSGQGYDGSSAGPQGTGRGGSGGGAGAAGSINPSNSSPLAGGAGLASSITGSAVTRAVGGAINQGSAGGANTGTGGVGGHNVAGLAGGSGVVILRMLTSNYSGTTSGSPTVSTSGSDTILTYTGSGSYTG